MQQDIITFESGADSYLFLVNGSQLFQVDGDVATEFKQAISSDDHDRIDGLFNAYNLNNPVSCESYLQADAPIHALSLAIAQKCNMGCSYCYAQSGDFGAPSKNMSHETAITAVRRLLFARHAGERVNLAFMGGEPLINRKVLRSATRYAAELASERDIAISYSITTNGTLLTPEDGRFFEDFGFAVTVSLDGVGSEHDQQRPFKNGQASYDRIMRRIEPLLSFQQKMQLSARITVTANNLNLPHTLQSFIDKGFHSVGFSPMLTAPDGRHEMTSSNLQQMLTAMIECAEQCEQAILQGHRFPFANMINALQEIHKGTHRPYPCGAGAGYLGVSADGDLAACHRFVGNEKAAMGNIYSGIDTSARERWLTQRHVHQQQPCSDCWARYLCGGGCHHEVLARGRNSCDYIRGWLSHCLQAYARLIDARADYFNATDHKGAN
ncbi:Arylsulfatase regulator (Fe-S oxidoreductase) [hydrothermal vent metagenome]|uniref:Arylsulfatase regulator (Fe-S oxidoreductase) n=1 Tax=hydrothermal vent metagenome TaxID=652676 RepID=A0A3B0YDQ1_9ZZZZ